MRANFRVEPGVLLDYWQGGGGFAPPEVRPPEWVLDDVRQELVSIERARDVYKVAITVVDEDLAEYVVDAEATAKLPA